MLCNPGFLYQLQPWNYEIGQSSEACQGVDTGSIILYIIQEQKVLKECMEELQNKWRESNYHPTRNPVKYDQ